MKTQILIISICLILSGCSMVSKELYPGMEYRENPKILELEYTSFKKLQKDCYNQDRIPGGVYHGCASTPLDSEGTCIIRYMKFDDDARKHELMHCHGYKDTFFFWNALKY